MRTWVQQGKQGVEKRLVGHAAATCELANHADHGLQGVHDVGHGVCSATGE